MNIIIFGSCGFIGSALCSYFERINSVKVFGVDLLEKEECNYFCIKKDENSIVNIINKCRPDIVINASGAANVSLSIQEPEWDYRANVEMVFNLLNTIRQISPHCKFIQLSSAAVYGNPLKLPVLESEPVKPMSPYGFHKWQSEIICKEFTQIYNIQTTILRIFSAYGVGLRKQLFWDLYKKASCNQAISLFGTGNESRDFIYIDDIVQAIELIIERGDFNASIYNVGNSEEVRIRDAVQLFLKEIGWEGELNFTGGNREGDPLNWEADTSGLKSLGYQRKISFTKGIELYCQWLKESE